MPEPEIKIEEEEVKEEEVTVEEVTDKILDGEERVDIDGGPGKDHPRFKKVYAQLKDSERKIEELEKSGKENTSLMTEMKEHNKSLQSAMERSATANEKIAEATVKATEQGAEDTFVKELQDAKNRLLGQKKEALEQNDYGRIVEIDDQIADIKLEIKDSKNKPVDKKPEVTTNTELSPERQKEVTRFLGNTSQWWEKDPMMTGAAKQIEHSLLIDVEWLNKPYGDLLDEVQKRVEERFGHTKKKDDLPRVNTVEGSGNVSPKGGPVVVKLSQKELKMAKGLGVTPEQWAQQKALKEATG